MKNNNTPNKSADFKKRINDFLQSYPAIKHFGKAGIAVIIAIFILSTIFSSEIENKWDDFRDWILANKIKCTASVTISYEPIFSLTDQNAIIYADTSFEAEKVELICVSGDKTYGTWYMEQDSANRWIFNANFYEPNLYTITVNAYINDKVYITASKDIPYPFT